MLLASTAGKLSAARQKSFRHFKITRLRKRIWRGSAHGVRKIAATTAANNGATTSQLKALFGWTSDAMPTLYTRAADRERLGREAGHMLANENRTSIPSPRCKVRAPDENSK